METTEETNEVSDKNESEQKPPKMELCKWSNCYACACFAFEQEAQGSKE